MRELPTGTVSFLFTDIEGSTRLLQELGGEEYKAVLENHHELMRRAISAAGGVTVSIEGDSFFAVFADASDAVGAAVEAQRALALHSWPEGHPVSVRMGVLTGSGVLGGEDYVGIDVHRAARLMSSAHGDQVAISESTYSLVRDNPPDGVGLWTWDRIF